MKSIDIKGKNVTIEAIGALLMKHYPECEVKQKKSSPSLVLKKTLWTQVFIKVTENEIKIRTEMSTTARRWVGIIGYFLIDEQFGEEVGVLIGKELDYLCLHSKEEESFSKDKNKSGGSISGNAYKYRWFTFLYNILALVVITVGFILLSPPFYYYIPYGEESLVCRQDVQTKKYGFVNKQEEWVIKPVFDEKGSFYARGDFAATKFDNFPCVIDKSGNIVCVGETENDNFDLNKITDEITVVEYRNAKRDESRHGGLNSAGQLVIPIIYSDIKTVSKNVIACEIGETGYTYYDDKGNKVRNFLTIRYELTEFLVGGRWYVMLATVLILLNVMRYLRYRKKKRSGIALQLP